MKLKTYLLVLSASILSACGGSGGGGSSSTPVAAAAPVASTPPATTTTPGAAPGTLVTTVPAVTGSADHVAAFAALNAARNTCGFGLVAQNAQLETSAGNHAAYIGSNFAAHPDAYGHTEVAAYTGFTGAQPLDRDNFAGYGGMTAAEELVSAGSSDMPQTYGVTVLLTVGYHLENLMTGYFDAGIASATVIPATSTVGASVAPVIELGSKTAALQDIGSATVATYPCAGITVKTSPAGIPREEPDPFPARDYGARPLGAPIFIKVKAGQALAITSVTVANAGGTPVAQAGLFTAATDPNHFLTANEALWYPDAPLVAGVYNATIVGTNNGTSFTKNFSFTTT